MPIKGYIKNVSTGERKTFQFNPPTITTTRGANYAALTAPGISYPRMQYVNGDFETFTVPLFLYQYRQARLAGEPPVEDNAAAMTAYRQGVGSTWVALIPDWVEGEVAWLEQFLPPTENTVDYTPPPKLIFVLGPFIRRCILTNISEAREQFDKYLNQTMTTVTLSLTTVYT